MAQKPPVEPDRKRRRTTGEASDRTHRLRPFTTQEEAANLDAAGGVGPEGDESLVVVDNPDDMDLYFEDETPSPARHPDAQDRGRRKRQ